MKVETLLDEEYLHLRFILEVKFHDSELKEVWTDWARFIFYLIEI
jgi:hypothetical protein